MPTLPSGLAVGIMDDLSVKHGRDWWSCPPGHLWFQKPDLELCPPRPWLVPTGALTDIVHVPLPTHPEGAYPHLIVLIKSPEGRFHWSGYLLGEVLEGAWLDDADRAALAAWLKSDRAVAFIENMLQEWAALAERAQKVTGAAKFTSRPSGASD